MNRIYLFITSILLLSLLSCRQRIQNVVYIASDDSDVIVCDEEKVTEKREVKISELVDDFQIIELDNRDEAFFKWRWIYFSDNYFCIKPNDGPVKLFSKSGKFVANVGDRGQGPGEYKTVNNILIDEAASTIYLPPYAGKEILMYDMQGEYIEEIEFGSRLNNPRISIQDSVLSLVHLCFSDKDSQFTTANVQLNNIDSIDYVFASQFATKAFNEEGKYMGLVHEIWSYRNIPEFSFMHTSGDTVYHYDQSVNTITARFALRRDPEERKNSFAQINELPHHYLIRIVKKGGCNILVDKRTNEAYQASLVNDHMGNMSLPAHFQDGHYFAMYEPMRYKELIEEHLASGKCPEDQVEKLTSYMESLNEDGNNILLVGKVKS